ncbi:MAG: glycerophosphodiester phosphodiesterase [Acidimicrobiales bacterium]
MAFAHRGGAIDAPENSLEAFEMAHDLGFRHLETDVHLTADGILVAFHDSTLDRVTDAGGAIAKRSFAEIGEMRVEGSGRIASMEQLLERFPDTSFNIDAKADAAVTPLIELFERTDTWNRVCFASFFDRRIRRARKIAGDRLCISAGVGQVVRHMARSRGLGIRANDAHVMQVPITFMGIPVLTAAFVRAAHADGLHVHAWTIDEPEEMHDLFDMGVDGIMTDRPQALRDVMIDRGLWTTD